MLSKGITETLVSTGAPDRAMVLRKGSDSELASGIESPKVGIIKSAPGVKKQGSTLSLIGGARRVPARPPVGGAGP